METKIDFPFELEPRTGILRTTERLDRDRKNQNYLWNFEIEAFNPPYPSDSDLIRTARVTVKLKNENDNKPIIRKVYTKENKTHKGWLYP